LKRQASLRSEQPADTYPNVSSTTNKLKLDQDKKGRANPQKETKVKATTHRKIKLGTVLIMLDMGQQVQCNAMLDNGCETTSIDRDWVRSKGLNTFPLRERIVIRNADGTINEDGTCTSILQARLRIG
jgi:hypothetical protein